MDIIDYLRKKGYKLNFSKNKITAEKNNKLFEAKNLTFLLNNVVNDVYTDLTPSPYIVTNLKDI